MRRPKSPLRTYLGGFVLLVANVFLIVIVLMTAVSLVVVRGGLQSSPVVSSAAFGVAAMLLICAVVATSVIVMMQRLFVWPLYRIADVLNEVAAGNFDARIDLGRGRYPSEVRAFADSVNRTAAELAGIELLRTDFVNSFSHEFKTPIASLAGFARLLKRPGLSDGERERYLDAIIAESDRLASLSSSVLALSKADAQQIVADRAPVNLTEQVRRAVLALEARWVEKDIALELDLEETTYLGSSDLLNHAWTNLLDNAAKFSPAGGTVRVELHAFPGSVAFTVRDEGPGMDDAVRERAFERFYQGDPSRATPGNGIGLALVKRVAELHGGRVSVVSAPGAGSAFSVVLPTL